MKGRGFCLKHGEQQVFPSQLDEAQRIQLVLFRLKQAKFRQDSGLYRLFSTKNRRGELFVPLKTKKRFLAALAGDKELVKIVLPRFGSSWFTFLASSQEERLFADLWKDPEIPTPFLADAFWKGMKKMKNPKAASFFFQWATRIRPWLTPDFLASYEATLRPEWAEILLNWVLKTDSKWVHQSWASRIPPFLLPFPTPQGKEILGRLLLSKVEKVRREARKVLDDWKRLEELNRGEKNKDLEAKLHGIVASGASIASKVVALRGLFDLGDKAAWLLLARWLDSDDPKLKAAGLALAQEFSFGRSKKKR